MLSHVIDFMVRHNRLCVILLCTQAKCGPRFKLIIKSLNILTVVYNQTKIGTLLL